MQFLCKSVVVDFPLKRDLFPGVVSITSLGFSESCTRGSIV